MTFFACKPEKILIRSTNWIGDAIITTPAVRTIRENFPEAVICILAYPWVADVFAASPHVDKVILYHKKTYHSGLAGLWRLGRELATYDFDAAILLQSAFEAALIAKLASIPVRAGYKRDGRGMLLTHGVKVKDAIKKIHQVHYYQALLAELGLCSGTDELILQLSKPVNHWAEEFIAAQDSHLVVGLNPGAAYGPAKCWPAEKYGELAGCLCKEMGAAVLVFGTRDDQAAGAVIKESAKGHVVDLTGKTSLAEAMALIGRCDAFVTNDSGLMHVAAALKVPLAAIFGSTNPLTTGPFSKNSVIIRKNIDCSPCLKTHCREDFRCMTTISVSEVLEQVIYLLKGKHQK